MNARAITFAARISLAIAVAATLFLATTDRSLPAIDTMWDKGKHAFAFAVLAFLADLSFPKTRLGPAKIAALLAFGVLIEVIQHFVPPREASLLDVVADAAGIALYALLLPLLLRLRIFPAAAKG